MLVAVWWLDGAYSGTERTYDVATSRRDAARREEMAKRVGKPVPLTPERRKFFDDNWDDAIPAEELAARHDERER